MYACANLLRERSEWARNVNMIIAVLANGLRVLTSLFPVACHNQGRSGSGDLRTVMRKRSSGISPIFVSSSWTSTNAENERRVDVSKNFSAAREPHGTLCQQPSNAGQTASLS